MSSDFAWPPIYDFPPFFTLQPNAETRRKQLDQWCSLVLTYFKDKHLHQLDVDETLNSPLFNNGKIKRKLSLDFVHTILNELQRRGNLEWIVEKKKCTIVWRTKEEWGDLVYTYAKANGLTGSVCTLYELTDGDDTEGQPFHGLDKDILLEALRSLEKSGRAEIMMFDSHEGVKFL